ncbi:MAG TPA: dienelactone hydrolase family protein [Acidobacteriota bacterium]|nr:dienelactone hydrolase family protein [Acidobacteriota bacterium]HNB69513.1 dienelactone hydrolase family protein [Acidobacteriota bacterium]HNC42889.1 dienelactone hydrolase family protein [Acidobacteriota bacterium]HND19913.1 dienelactone hydrolase family protein [Acidobacteriota bacterium]HNH84284.1 dienelactone hydrolase family protein [Acidobacteriota bacterium]
MGNRTQFTANGLTIDGYLAVPASGTGPGVIVLQEWWGLVPHIESIADRFAAAGYTAFAPDLYHGQQATGPDQAGKLMMSLRIDEAAREMQAAIQGLLALPHTSGFSKVGSVGFCMGGLLSLYAACKNPEIGACVIFYGGFPGVTPEIASLTSPVLGLYAGKDTFVTVASVHQLEQILQHHQKPYSFHIYSDADHAFFNDTRPEVYREADARDAWERVLAFYQAHLWGGHQG